MGVSSTANRVLLAGDGASVTFVFPYYFFNQTDLQVWVYDTILGGAVQQTLNTNYMISGTPNLQGLYQNGANVVFSVAPLATSIVVIFRNPPQVSNYALGQNGNISSAAIVQQFDYLTLLAQRLQDQINKAISLPDGIGEAFSNQLQSSAALLPGAVPTVNAAGNGWVLSTGGYFWQSITLPYSDFQALSTSEVVALFSIPPGAILNGLTIKHSTAFSGTAITDVQMSIGTGADATKFIDGFDVFSTVSDQNFDYINPNYIASWANTTQVNISAAAVGANLSALTAGSVTINYSIVQTS